MPQKLPYTGFYHPNSKVIHKDITGYIDWNEKNRLKGPENKNSHRAGIFFSRNQIEKNNLCGIDALINEIKKYNIIPVPVFSQQKEHANEDCHGYNIDLNQLKNADVIINCVSSFLFQTDMTADNNKTVLDLIDAPVFQAISSSGRSETEWRDSPQGITAMNQIYWVAQPEFNGTIEPTVIFAKDRESKDKYASLLPVKERIEFFVRRIKNWLQLKELPKNKRKQGINLPVTKRKIKVVDLPLGATEDRVLGSLDFEHAVKKGETFFTPGLLAAAHRGILYIDEVNLLDDHIVDVILDAAGMGMNIVEREGVSCMHRAEFILIGTMNPEEGELRPQLLDRFGMCIQVKGIKNPDERIRLIKRKECFDGNSPDFIAKFQGDQDELSQKIIRAKKRLFRVKISEKMIQLCSKSALDAFAAGHRADIIMRKTAISIASCEKREEVTEKDVNEAADLVLLHRVRMPPSPPQNQPEEKKEDPSPPEGKKEPEKGEEEAETRNQQKVGTGKEEEEREGEEKDKEEPEKGESASQPLEMVFSVGETFKVKRIQIERDRVLRKGSGRRSRTRSSSKAGRYIMSRMERKTNDLALDATIRAAAPYQKQRKREGVAIAIEESDIREKIREKRIGNFIVFVVDASGSMGAGKRMIETKGAILSLLLDAYQKRDKIAMVAFKGDHAEVLLPPTGSIELAHKLLEELPTGGKTPLCHGISLGYQIIKSHFRKDPDTYPLLIFISDGKANVSQYGGKPLSEAMEAAEEIKDDQRVNTVVVDVEKSGLISFGLAHQLSVRMGAGYFKIEDLKADTLVEVLRENLLR